MKKIRVRLTFRCLEYHTIEREVDAAELQKQREDGDAKAWLDEKFRDDSMSDSDINTESFELDEWSTPKQ